MHSCLTTVPRSPVQVTCCVHRGHPFLSTAFDSCTHGQFNSLSCSPSDDYNATLKSLKSKNRFPKKSLGQNYLLSAHINKELASIAAVRDGDVVLEIGPGTGALTNVLLGAGATVIGIEKDPYMVAIVSERFDGNKKLKVVHADVMKCSIESHFDAKFQRAKVVSNIPFNISSDVIKLLLPMGHLFSEVVLLLQDEVAFRLANPSLRTPEYRAINVFVSFYSVPKYKLKVPRTNFFPEPNVDAAVACFELKQASEYPRVPSVESFFAMVNAAFNEKRKMLRKSLQSIHAAAVIEDALRLIKRPVTARPEELTPNDFIRLHNVMADIGVSRGEINS